MSNGEAKLRDLVAKWRRTHAALSDGDSLQIAERFRINLCADELEAALAAPVQAEVGAGERGTIQWWIARCYEAENKLEALRLAVADKSK